MTTKYRIIFGFTLMVMLLVVISFFGHKNSGMSAKNIEEYRRVAQLSALHCNTTSAINAVTASVFQFLNNPENSGAIQGAHASVGTLISNIKRADSMDNDPDSDGILKKMLVAAQKINTNIDVISNNSTERQRLYATDVQQATQNLVGAMLNLGQGLYPLGNVDALASLSQAWAYLASVQGSLERFAESRDVEDGKKIRGYLELVNENIEKFSPHLSTQEGRTLHVNFLKSKDTLHANIASIGKNFDQANANITSMFTEINSIHAALSALNNNVTAQQEALWPQILAENESAQQHMLFTSVGGIAISVVLAGIIIWGIMRVLSDLSGYASAVALGDVSRQPKTREKGEIGNMVDAMKLIPITRTKILEEYKRLEKKIEEGYLNSEGDASGFAGEFSVLVSGTNNILARFRMVLENIPSPVVLLNKDLKASYLNSLARSLVGDNWQGVTCYELFHRDDYGTSSCGLTMAVQTKAPVTRETQAHPQGKTMDIRYTAIPMLDDQGNIAAVMQLLTDLTAIRSQEKAMLQVANQASEISDRVAAASEELSAQVGEISRGAAIQRSRVESTASAMAEMNSTVLEVAQNAAQAADQSHTSRDKAEGGSHLVNKVVQAINTVDKIAVHLQDNMKELGSQTENIGSIMNVITDIADQTNLLALNAAIEAARAGDAGRGFAVVADEVRKLAEKTMNATQEVSNAIVSIQAAARVNIEQVNSAVKSVTEATDLANASGVALDEIVSLASANSYVVSSIATAAEQQSATSEEISRAIEEINNIVNETSEGIIQSSTALQDLSQMAQKLRNDMAKLR